ncbi:oligosaccharide flippase family protein [Priestia sp. YIM B13448]|uniref:oligosaccharide flippase family protein n=1 Tax=Priestia sp. YIM B13448 TaxID=3366308 RepID=UPI00366BC7E6
MSSNKKNNVLVKNTVWVLIGQGLRIIIQAAYFIYIARLLGVEGYGAFISTVALVAIISPFSGIGAGNLLIKNVSRDRTLFNIYWGNALLMTLISSILLLMLVMVLSQFLLPSSLSLKLILLIAISDLFFAKVLDIGSQAFQAVQRLSYTAQLQILLSLFRMIGAVLLSVFNSRISVETWGYCYLFSTVISALIAVVCVCTVLGFPKLDYKRIKGEIKDGIYFSISFSAESIYSDIDKTMLSRLSSLEAAGIYATAYRIIDVAFTPVLALLRASYAKFFQYGTEGIRNTLTLIKKIFPLSLIYSILIAIILYFVAPIFPKFLGEEYKHSVDAIRYLCLIPLFRSVSYFAANILTGCNYQGYRTTAQLISSGVNIVLNFVLIPKLSWIGAVIACGTTNIFLSLLSWSLIWYLNSKTSKESNNEPKKHLIS